MDWNLLLSAEGGPNHLGNLCDAPLLATPDHGDVTVQPYLYAIGHFSKFFVPGTEVARSAVQADFSGGKGGGVGAFESLPALHGGPSRVVSGAARRAQLQKRAQTNPTIPSAAALPADAKRAAC